MYTSGTTNRPKGACSDHRRVFYTSIAMIGTMGFNADDRLLHVAPLFHAAHLGVVFNPGFFPGASYVILSAFEPEKVLETIERQRITFFFGVPTMFNMILQPLDRADYDLSSVGRIKDMIISGGENSYSVEKDYVIFAGTIAVTYDCRALIN